MPEPVKAFSASSQVSTGPTTPPRYVGRASFKRPTPARPGRRSPARPTAISGTSTASMSTPQTRRSSLPPRTPVSGGPPTGVSRGRNRLPGIRCMTSNSTPPMETLPWPAAAFPGSSGIRPTPAPPGTLRVSSERFSGRFVSNWRFRPTTAESTHPWISTRVRFGDPSTAACSSRESTRVPRTISAGRAGTTTPFGSDLRPASSFSTA